MQSRPVSRLRRQGNPFHSDTLLAAQSREPGIESGIVNVGPFSPFPTRTKMRLKLLAAGRPTATSPDGADPARPGRPRRITSSCTAEVSLTEPAALKQLVAAANLLLPGWPFFRLD